MPELPDVEVFRRYVGSTALGRTVTDLTLRRESDIVRGVSPTRLRKTLCGAKLTSTRRHGKYSFIELEGRGWLVMHFGMTGRVSYHKDEAREPEHTRLRLALDNGYHLSYVSQRLLGRLSLSDDVEGFVEKEGLGPDALALKLGPFRTIMSSRRGMIKPTLMNQSVIAGIGNIYSDEILFQAGVHPRAECSKLGDERTAALYRSMRTVLRTAIRHKADPRELPRSYLLPRRAEGAECPECGGRVRKIKIGGRAAYYCPKCQGK
jgi:formamidopyrimidine-DNA glycosylase